jgi:hypothetical protein
MDKFNFKKNKKSNNYSIFSKKGKKISFKLKSVYLPFGREYYNNKSIINIIIDDSDNINYNNIIILKKYSKVFSKFKNNSVDYFNISDKEYHEFIKMNDNIDNNNNNDIDDNVDDNEIDKKYFKIRCYLSNSVKITHKKYIGEVNVKDIKKKIVDIELEIGSLWTNKIINKYGVNIYINKINVLN